MYSSALQPLFLMRVQTLVDGSNIPTACPLDAHLLNVAATVVANVDTSYCVVYA